MCEFDTTFVRNFRIDAVDLDHLWGGGHTQPSSFTF